MEKILGIVYAYDLKDAYQEILDLGFSWIRMGICFPWKDRMFGTLCEDYLKDREQMKRAHEAGIQIMPSTPGMGGYYYSETDGETDTGTHGLILWEKRELRNTTGMWRIPALLSAGT